MGETHGMAKRKTNERLSNERHAAAHPLATIRPARVAMGSRIDDHPR